MRRRKKVNLPLFDHMSASPLVKRSGLCPSFVHCNIVVGPLESHLCSVTLEIHSLVFFFPRMRMAAINHERSLSHVPPSKRSALSHVAAQNLRGRSKRQRGPLTIWRLNLPFLAFSRQGPIFFKDLTPIGIIFDRT